jgi:hypothetical protein
VGAVARIDFTIEVGIVTESVEVQGNAALLTTENTAVGTVIENRRIVELPLDGRNYLQMVALSPESVRTGASKPGGLLWSMKPHELSPLSGQSDSEAG